MTRKDRYDVLVVGARCAGAATAMLLARQGARILVVDHDRPGTDTVSTHALMRGGVMQLARWGLLDRIRAAGTPAIRRTSFWYGGEPLHVDIPPLHGTDALHAPRRTVLDAALAAAAWAAGAEIRYQTSLRRLRRDAQGRVRGAELSSRNGSRFVEADLVIGADGRRSAVARDVGAEVQRRAGHASAFTYIYAGGLANLGYRWFWAQGAAGGIIPTNAGLSCVFLGLPLETMPRAIRDAAAFRAIVGQSVPELAAALERAPMAGRPVIFRGERGYIRRSTGPGWALVGDAAYFKDPITAHGLTDALRDAELLAEMHTQGDPQLYQEIRDTLTADFFRLTDRIASYHWSLEEVKDLHVELNRAMKPTQSWIAERIPVLAKVA